MKSKNSRYIIKSEGRSANYNGGSVDSSDKLGDRDLLKCYQYSVGLVNSGNSSLAA